jgi:hypothetical protein
MLPSPAFAGWRLGRGEVQNGVRLSDWRSVMGCPARGLAAPGERCAGLGRGDWPGREARREVFLFLEAILGAVDVLTAEARSLARGLGNGEP